MGADLEALDDDGERALQRAVEYNHMNIPMLLLDHGAMADPQKEVDSGRTPHFIAVENGNYDIVQLLIEKGADIELDSEIFDPPLMVAVYGAGEDTIRLLLDSGADPNTETASGHGGSALHRAVSRPFFFDSEILRLLVTKGANLEAKDHDGRTLLLLAVELARIDMVSLLLELGADPTSVDVDTMPERYVEKSEFETAMQLIDDTKQRWIEGARSKSPSPSINGPVTKCRISRISD